MITGFQGSKSSHTDNIVVMDCIHMDRSLSILYWIQDQVMPSVKEVIRLLSGLSDC